jgi:hypothetical protein
MSSPEPSGRREVSRWEYIAPDGQLRSGPLEYLTDPNDLPFCHSPHPTPNFALGLPYVHWHSHVFFSGEQLAYCGLLQKYDPLANGGALRESNDWDLAEYNGEFIIGPEYVVKLTPGTPEGEREYNPYKWKVNSNKCLSPVPPPPRI